MFIFGGNPDNSYKIERSLRFNSADSAYLSRTPSAASNRKTWTYSCWVKRCSLSNEYLFNGGPQTNGTQSTDIRFDADALYVAANTVGTTVVWSVKTTAVFRDPSAWYHVVVAVDTKHATASERVRIYVNGTRITQFTTANYPTQNYDTAINNSVLHSFGSAGAYMNDYLTEVHFIDGAALGPDRFGKADPVTGVWSPKKYDFEFPALSVEYVVIAGGGAGAVNRGAGGGGAGGYRSSVSGEMSGGGANAETPLALSTGVVYTVTVGAGGAGVSSGAANNGSNSVFSSITSTGGGRGASNLDPVTSPWNGYAGGSGGGAGGAAGAGGTGGSGTANQGYSGGSSSSGATTSNQEGGGGGGGAGAVGGNATVVNTGANGGNGVSSSITGTATFRAAGGGGAAYSSTAAATTAGSGGLGGGGAGRATSGGNGNAGSGTANTGSGGGGHPNQNITGSSGSGGSGLVALRYPFTYNATFSAGVTQTTTTIGDYKVSVITAAGPTDTVTFS